MRKAIPFLALIFSTSIFCQDSLKMKIIDSVIDENAGKVARTVTDMWLPIGISVSHGKPDTVINIFKFSSNNKLIEFSKIWFSNKDTTQITSFFYNASNLIKVVTRIPYDSYMQFAYFEKRKVVWAGDTEGKLNPNTDYDLKRSKKILKSAKLRSKI